MNFSIILNSRGRINLLDNLLCSIIRNSMNIDNLEVFVCLDSDDNETVCRCNDFIDRFKFVNFYIVEHTENLHNNLNEAFKYTKGKYILILNDDCEILTKNWDVNTFNALEKFLENTPDGICYGRTHDTSVDKGGNKEYSSFPVLSAKAVRAAGFVMPEYVKGWGGDVLSWRIYNSINRIVDLPDLVIEHVLHNKLDKIMNPDSTQSFIRQISAQNNIDYFTADITAHTTQLNSIICQKQSNKLKKGNKLCIVYNTCGISGTEKVNNYIHSIRTILNQDFDGAEIVISGCLNSQATKDKLHKEFRNTVNYNWIDEKFPINVTFNHSCLKARQELGNFEGYLYIDSGISFTSDDSLTKLYNLFKSDSFGMVSAQTSTDAGYQQWFDVGQHPHDTTENHKLFANGDFVVPLGKAVNLHCQIFHSDLLNYYSGLMPDIFSSYCTESTFSFLCAALKLKWVISKDVMAHHHISMDGASSGFSPIEWTANRKPTWDHPYIIKSILPIMIEGQQYGMGYEECSNIVMHNPEKFNEDGEARDVRLRDFIRDNLFLINSNKLNYANINYTWESGK